jgi:DNA-binding SARP family transcriptional activator/tetratricopeptide (TPR) repeat protein
LACSVTFRWRMSATEGTVAQWLLVLPRHPGASNAEVSGMRFTLLGTLAVADDAGEPVAVPGARQRALLASLLLSANVPVSAAALAEAVWDGSPPPGSAATLRSHIRRLRQALGPQAAARIRARDPGHVIVVREEELDVLRFEAACRDSSTARRAARWPQASAASAQALELWRGPPLADVDSQVLRDRFVPRLEQLRVQVTEDRAEAELRLGRHDRLIPELRDLAAEHPLRERFHAQLIEALARAGRQAEALQAYQRVRRALVDELGIEPGPHLQRLHQQVLHGGPTLAGKSSAVADPAPTAPPAPDSSRVTVPRQLPGTVPQFTGRSQELAQLSRQVDGADRQAPGAVVIAAIAGTAGVGKTALAIRWAHQVADRFPDGQLYVNLRGYDPGPMVTPADALAGFLRALGVPGQDIPLDPEGRAARYRSLVAGRRVLIVLDNARSAEQVRSLLPATPACLTVVTSRDSLAGLAAREGAVRLNLDLLPEADAIKLLCALIGERAGADPAATTQLAVQCSRLPLALRVAAELASARPATSLADLVRELADQQQRLHVLDAGGDPRTAVRAVFSWSYRHLAPEAARTFRRLGLHPGLDLDYYAAAALTGASVAEAKRALEALTRAQLTHLTGPGRYGTHDLLRAYARDLSFASESDQDRRAALTRLFDHYLHTAAAAMDTLFPSEQHRRPRIPLPGTPVPFVTDFSAALAWMDNERSTLVAAAVLAASRGWPSHASRLAATLFRYLDDGGHYTEAATIHSQARIASSQTSDRMAQAEAEVNLGVVALRQGRRPQAAAHFRAGSALFHETGDRAGEMRALGNVGIFNLQLGRYKEATGLLQRTLALCAEINDRTGEARVLAALSTIDFQLGHYELAITRIHYTMAICQETGDRTGEGHALCGLGEVVARQGDGEQAIELLQQALDLFRKIGCRSGDARVLTILGDTGLRQGYYEQAAAYQRQALAVCRAIGYQSGEVTALNGLGDVFLATGQPAVARAQYAAALSGSAQNGEVFEQARAHNGLARAHEASGELGQARHHWTEALTRYVTMEMPEAAMARTHLARITDSRLTGGAGRGPN